MKKILIQLFQLEDLLDVTDSDTDCVLLCSMYPGNDRAAVHRVGTVTTTLPEKKEVSLTLSKVKFCSVNVYLNKTTNCATADRGTVCACVVAAETHTKQRANQSYSHTHIHVHNSLPELSGKRQKTLPASRYHQTHLL